MIVEETNLGNYEDKVLKHELAARTAGVEDLEQYVKTGDTGLALTEMAPLESLVQRHRLQIQPKLLFQMG